MLTTTDLDLVPAIPVARVGFVSLSDVLDLEGDPDHFDEGPVLAMLRPPRNEAGGSLGFSHSPDFRSVRWSDQNFDFSVKQARAIEALHEAWFDGSKKRSQATLQGLGIGQRMTELFRRHPAYGTFILNDGQGLYWLAL